MKVRNFLTGAAVVLGVMALSATPAHAKPGEPGDRSYQGPVTSSLFAGHRVTANACVTRSDRGVYRLPCREVLERD